MLSNPAIISRRGFTVFEIVIAVAIIAIVATIILGQAGVFRRQAALAGEAERLLTILERARTETLASKDSLNYGVYFEVGAVTIFSGSAYVAGATGNEVISLDSSVEIIAIDFTDNQVVFERLTGVASNSGSITLALAADNTKIKQIAVGASGIGSLR
ncbi:MAG: hypothetical protein A2114_00370 [Candidatus Vogelbacteria bacterium GWA1_51_14]|uniref:General secretion pathway GspH domain-containing protein n=1 Tax=Candidatus Vogelbacteria bacterium GWA1_51_14 TaxID=1802435 RepID=A0A1G2Q8R5_9BACT|nr:MAG: hypothetical protein A2114_00370 [Candidatus Vogelbacteria bacterium GWA1_51_14]